LGDIGGKFMYKNKYPVILLHGFMGFGEQDGID
jgi:hypothetical protein